MVRCRSCGLLLTWPRPALELLRSLYDADEYYCARSMGEEARSAWTERARGILSTLPQRPCRVLDVGAGAGHFVRALRDLGLEADGVEPSAAGRRAARRLYALELMPELPERPHGYDLVSLVHALEHMPDPLGCLVQVRALLAPGRGAVFVEVPHAGSVEMWTRRRGEILDLPVHMYHFVPRTLTRLVEAAGLQVVRIELSNASVVEQALALWSRLKNQTALGSSVASAAPAAWDRPPVRRAAAAKSRLLGWVRTALPGWKFQLVATPRH